MFKKPDKFPHSAWMRLPASSFLITSAVFVVFILDMASPGYGSFALISDLRPKITTLTTDIRSDVDNFRGSESSLPHKTKSASDSNNCQTLLDAYKNNAKCHFNPKNY